VRDDREVLVLAHPHIIIEDTTRRHRSFHREFPPERGRSTLPALNWAAPPAASPFVSPHVAQERARISDDHRSVATP
jgi:hypothetical protein